MKPSHLNPYGGTFSAETSRWSCHARSFTVGPSYQNPMADPFSAEHSRSNLSTGTFPMRPSHRKLHARFFSQSFPAGNFPLNLPDKGYHTNLLCMVNHCKRNLPVRKFPPKQAQHFFLWRSMFGGNFQMNRAARKHWIKTKIICAIMVQPTNSR